MKQDKVEHWQQLSTFSYQKMFQFIHLYATFVMEGAGQVSCHDLSNNLHRLMFEMMLSHKVFASKNGTTASVGRGAAPKK